MIEAPWWHDVKYWEEEAFYNPKLKSSSGRRGKAESLDYDLPSSFFAFLFLDLYETGKLEGAGVTFLSLPQVR